MRTKPALYMLLLFVVVALFSCGGDDICPPPGSTITIEPEDVSVTDGGAVTQTHTQFFKIYVADPQERPIEGAKISLFFIWANPDPYNVVQFYDGITPVTSPFSTETDEYGVYNLRMEFVSGGGLEYSGNIEVYSCSVFASAAFDVAAE